MSLMCFHLHASIWLHQFLKAMRDKEGNVLKNAHILGFFRRICKLLFFNIKPIFVFDGGVPALKRRTVAERRQRREGAANIVQKTAEKMLASQLRLRAIQEVEGTINDEKQNIGHIPDNVVYYDEINLSPHQRYKQKKHDEYDLPPMQESFESLSKKDDLRFATEDDLRRYIEDFKRDSSQLSLLDLLLVILDLNQTEDIDIDSEHFRSLPIETQYEIVSELRLKSRRTSWHRLNTMSAYLDNHKNTALDFSKLQIENLVHRNSLTQKLLDVTGLGSNSTNGNPVKIASERNKEYILIKNTSDKGGWTIGIKGSKAAGTKAEPVEVDTSSDEKSDEWEEAEHTDKRTSEVIEVISDDDGGGGNDVVLSKKLDEGSLEGEATLEEIDDVVIYDRENLLLNPVAYVHEDESISSVMAKFGRLEQDDTLSHTHARSISPSSSPAPPSPAQSPQIVTSNNFAWSPEELDLPIDTFYGIWISRAPNSFTAEYPDHEILIHDAIYKWNTEELQRELNNVTKKSGKMKDGDCKTYAYLYWECLLKAIIERRKIEKVDNLEGAAKDTEEAMVETSSWKGKSVDVYSVTQASDDGASRMKPIILDESDDDMGDLPSLSQGKSLFSSNAIEVTSIEEFSAQESMPFDHIIASDSPVTIPEITRTSFVGNCSVVDSSNDSDMEEVVTEIPQSTTSIEKVPSIATVQTPNMESPLTRNLSVESPFFTKQAVSNIDSVATISSASSSSEDEGDLDNYAASNDEEYSIPSRLNEENTEFARFISEVKNKDLGTVQRELDHELQQLDEKQRSERRIADDITQTMIDDCQHLLRLFGIPYIVAPMEAEAQCAELCRLSLADAIVSDDCDVFLFGGSRVYKNMFNNHKYVECYLASDIERELHLDREKLIIMALLLGSDYAEGLQGVGVVTAMEILNEFQGEDVLVSFRDWWIEVQNGRDKGGVKESEFKRNFRKKQKDLFLSTDFPDRRVFDAYMRPQVDDSEAHFEWGLPDLDSLRDFLMRNLSWPEDKVDATVVPVIKNMTLQKDAAAKRHQLKIDAFLTSTVDAPTTKRRRVHRSRRIQRIIDQWNQKTSMSSKNNDDSDNSPQVVKTSSSELSSDTDNTLDVASAQVRIRKKNKPIGKIRKRKRRMHG
ncbi:9314_t:CDS:10 [Paraglomus occultum]|uniref:9314_t:CDS:1 n=1 Tax=Paraglomus occultum TaxID=144539 RepID=A0A9N8WN78_9GLOM|nr:9314_t:CDS:10 [Paraglomus occultum]